MKHDFKSLAALYEYATTVYAKRPASQFVSGGQSYTYASFDDACRSLSRTLANFGVSTYDKVAILSENMPNWSVAFFSAAAFGRIAVPMLPGLTPNEIENILKHSDTKALFVSSRLLSKVPEHMLARMSIVIQTDDLSVVRCNDADYTCDGRISRPQEDDIAALIYTSGTTGAAKGVMLSHRNLCANVLAAWKAHKVRRRDVFLSILPMAHAYELSLGVLYPFSVGARVYYINKAPTASVLLPVMKRIRPTVMLSVPLIMEKIYKSSVVPTVKSSQFLMWLKGWAPGLLDWMIGKKLKKSFGGRIHFFGIGGAKLDPVVEDFLNRARFPYAVGYGLTETAPLITNACVGKTRVGCIGVPAYGMQVRLDNVNPQTGEGEIIAKGPQVMRGYYKDYRRTLGVITDGWFHTGDLASMDSKGRYYIKGRMGNMILGPSGENIYPEEIEDVINSMDGVNESLVVERDGKLVALVKFDDNILDWSFEGEDKFIRSLEERRKAVMDYVNSHVNKNSKIGEVNVKKDPFVKTATLKIKRFLYKERKQDEK